MSRTRLTLFTLLALAAGAASAEARVVTHASDQSREHVFRYWTSERMREAVPASREGRVDPRASKGGTSSASGATSIEAPTPYPTAHGKVFFTDGGVNYVCS